jgi:glycosyltransferase involved in cell wall biosynthesis
MHIATYYQRVRLWNPTGVGKHILHMTAGLEKVFGSITHIQEFDDLRKARRLAVPAVAAPSFQHVLPIPRKVMKACWVKANFPPLEMFGVRPDWVYCPAEDYVARSWAKLAVTIHDPRPFEDRLPWSQSQEEVSYRARWQPILTRLVERADVVLTVSEYSRHRMVEVMGISPEKIVIVGNGVEDHFFLNSAESIEEPNPYILMVGGLQPRKGHTHIMELSRLLQRANSGLRIRIAGRGEVRCEEEGRKACNIDLLGYVSDEDLRDLMQRATAFVMLSEYEGFGIPVLEAMASRCPAIVINRTALPEVTGRAGIVVESAGEALEAIEAVATSSQTRRELVTAGCARAEAFRWSSCVDRLAAVLRES